MQYLNLRTWMAEPSTLKSEVARIPGDSNAWQGQGEREHLPAVA